MNNTCHWPSFNYTLNTAVPNGNVIFTDTSSGGVSPYTYLWQFGSGNI